MKAIRFYAPQDIRYEEVPITPPKAGEVVIKIKAALTCGTDVKTFRRGHPVLIKKIPSGFGHEFSGIIDELGEGVTNFKVGDRVAVANSAPCGECFFCKREQFNLCENLNLLNGAYAEYITVPERVVSKNMYVIPDNLSFEKAAFCEPLANVVHGVARTEIKAGQSVGIIGIGPIGLMFARVAKLKGARVIVAGRNETKLRLADEFAHAEYITVPERIVSKNMYVIPDNLSFEKAAFCEPLANVVHGVARTEIKAGQSVGIIGIGPIGLMFARVAKLKGARVIVAGRNETKLRLADEFAHADEIIDLKKYPNPEKIFKGFSDENKGLDVAVECVGLPEIWEQVFGLVRKGGTVHFFGGCKSGSTVTFDTTKMHYGDIKIMSVFHHTPKYFKEALDLIASGDIEVEKLITEKLGLKDVEYAMKQHIDGKAIKFLIKP